MRVMLRRLSLLMVFGMGGCMTWLLRDPVPHILSRRTTTLQSQSLETTTGAGHRNERIRVTGENGLSFDIQIRSPVGVLASRVPAFVILGGYETGDRAATLIPDTRGNMVVALSYPYDGDVHLKGFEVVGAVASLRRAILDTPAAVMLAVDYLFSRPDIDTARVDLVGASFGTAFVTLAGALDPRIARVWSIHGAADPYRLIEHNLRERIPYAGARIPVAAGATLFASGWQLDPARWVGRIAPRPFIMINAREDERMPRRAVESLFANAREPRELIWLEGPHVQANRPGIIAQLVETVLERSSWCGGQGERGCETTRD